jgi:DNA-binding transcriptional LysR family regulator
VRPTEPELVVKRLGRFAFQLYGHRAYLARTRPRDHEFIAFDASGESLPQHAWLLRHAGSRRIALRTNDLESQLAAALAQVGIVTLPAYMSARYPELVRVPSRLRPVTRELWLVVHEDLRAVAIVRAVIDFLTECTASVR